MVFESPIRTRVSGLHCLSQRVDNDAMELNEEQMRAELAEMAAKADRITDEVLGDDQRARSHLVNRVYDLV